MIELDDIDPAHHSGLTALADDMRAHGYQRSDPVREVFSLLGDRWTMLILLTLDIGTFRHAELLRAIARLSAEGRISQRVLTLKLRTLERNGLVDRHATTDAPPKVSYSLTELGLALLAEARRMMNWVHAHRKGIDAARAHFDAQSD